MKNIIKIAFLIITVILFEIYAEANVWYKYKGTVNYSVENSLYDKIPTPNGYKRIKVYKNSFAEWVRFLPVKPLNSSILTYKRKKLSNFFCFFYKVWRVVDIPLYFKQDIEQCADWAYRFWYEYQKEVGFNSRLWLTYYNGRKIIYGKWKKGRKNPGYKKFFKWTCNYANSYSQKKGLYKVKEEHLHPGDIIVQNRDGGIGHVSIIFDICENNNGEKLYLIGYSFMPAQECHIEKATDKYGLKGWFRLNGYFKYLEKHLNYDKYGKPVLRSFIQQNSLNLTTKAITNWERFEIAVRDSNLSIEEAAVLLPEIMRELNRFAQKHEFSKLDKWVFPVDGSSLLDVGGKQGNGFKPNIRYGNSLIKGYSFFDGNRHGGHPAHDIFIRDRNQDCLDDQSKKPVFVQAMMDGIVVSTFEDWQSGSKIRGGNYVWCYHPQENLISYYAHLKNIIVKPGQRVSAGDRLGTMGRTGFSAEPSRSPTHLHLMVLKYKNNKLLPYDYYQKINKE